MTLEEQATELGYIAIDPETGDEPVSGQVWPANVQAIMDARAEAQRLADVAAEVKRLADQAEYDEQHPGWRERREKQKQEVEDDEKKWPMVFGMPFMITYKQAVELEEATWDSEYGERRGGEFVDKLINVFAKYFPSILHGRD